MDANADNGHFEPSSPTYYDGVDEEERKRVG